jgi:hypothetical protein
MCLLLIFYDTTKASGPDLQPMEINKDFRMQQGCGTTGQARNAATCLRP